MNPHGIIFNTVLVAVPSVDLVASVNMHIKQITISNFRSFRQQPEIQPFAPTTNVVVGRNGSGKSNLFDAVQFVLLSPRFATLRSVSNLIRNDCYALLCIL